MFLCKGYSVELIKIVRCSGDGVIDANDIVDKFDTDNDGKLDATELKKLSDQLNSQLEYNNVLLEQLRESEERQLSLQKEIKAQQEAHRQDVHASEGQNSIISELKRKLKVTQEIADTMSTQARDARLEVVSLKRDAENAIKHSNEAKSMLKDVMDERSRLHRSLAQAQNATNAAKEEADHEKIELASQNDLLRQTHEALVVENAELRSKVIPIEAEKKTLQDHIRALTKSLEEVTARCDAESQNRNLLEKKLKDATGTIEGLRNKHQEMQHVVQQATGRADAHAATIKNLENQGNSMEAQIHSLENQITQQKKQLKQEREESVAMEEEISHLGAELLSHTKQRLQDQERWAERLEAAKKEMLSSAEEARAQAEEFALDAQRRASEAIESRKVLEEKYLNTQVECSELHSLIQQSQERHQQALEEWQAQHEELERVISDLERKNALSEDEIDNMHALLIAEREQSADTLQGLRNQMHQRGERYVGMLSTLQAALSRVKGEAATNRDRVREVVAQFAVLRAFVEQLWGNLHPPLESWKSELQQVHKALTNKCKEAAESLEDSRDDVRRALLAKEEERSKTLMLEENVSRLEHELTGYDNKVADAENKAQQKVLTMKAKVDQIVSEKEEMEARILRLQQSLDATSAQARQLQSSNQAIQNNLGASTAKQTAAKSEIQGKISQLSAQLKRANQEREQSAKVADDAQDKYYSLKQEADSTKSALEVARADIARLMREQEISVSKQSEALSKVEVTTGKYEEQLKQTQQLLKVVSMYSFLSHPYKLLNLQVVQSQKSELQSQNRGLREELDAVIEAKRQLVCHYNNRTY